MNWKSVREFLKVKPWKLCLPIIAALSYFAAYTMSLPGAMRIATSSPTNYLLYVFVMVTLPSLFGFPIFFAAVLNLSNAVLIFWFVVGYYYIFSSYLDWIICMRARKQLGYTILVLWLLLNIIFNFWSRFRYLNLLFLILRYLGR